MGAPGSIQPIDKGTVHRICSGQVILDLATATKELVENSLDAGATNVEVRLKEYGVELIEVADNGCGISPADYHALTRKYHTSKLIHFTDLQDLDTFGFRGEALSSICAMSELSVITRQAEQSAGVRLEFDHKGELQRSSAAARSTGTTVSVRNIFSTLPVRFKEFKRNAKKEYAKMVTVLQAYALILTGVRIICTNQVAGAARSTVVSTQGAAFVRDNIVTVFGARTAEGLEALSAPAGAAARFEGFVSKGGAGMSRATGDRQFIYLNGRPVDMPRMNKLVNETFRSLTSPALAHHKPMFVIDIVAPRHSYDINVTPDKRKVFFQDEKELLAAIQEALNEVWEPTRSKYRVGGVTQPASQRSTGALHVTALREADKEDNGRAETPESTDGQWSERPTVASSAERSGKRLSFSGLQRGTGLDGYRSSPLGEPSRASCGAGVPRSSALPASGQSALQPLISRFVRTANAGKATEDGSEVVESNEEAAAEPAHPRLRNSGSSGGSQASQPQSSPDGDRRGEPGICLEEAAQEDDPCKDACTEEKPLSASRGSQSDGAESDAMAEHPSDDTARAEGAPETAVADEAPPQSRCHAPGEHTKRQAGESDGQPSAKRLRWPACHVERAAMGERRNPQATGACRAEQLAVTDPVDLEPPKRHESVGRDMREAPEIPAPIPFDVKALTAKWRRALAARGQHQEQLASKAGFQAASLEGARSDELGQDEAAAESELERIFDKKSFRELRILGQFNLGFILARLGHDLFIIDQHASDEKFNFERLTRTTQLNRQPLLVPQKVDLTPSEVIIVREHMQVFAQNGFEFTEGPDGSLMLTGVPFSKNMTFGRADVQELAQLLGDGGSAPCSDALPAGIHRAAVNVSDKIPRPSRVRAMLASRACRSSIMIGRTLDRLTMRKVVDNLAGLESPWNCPHGRPTMRHLAVLRK